MRRLIFLAVPTSLLAILLLHPWFGFGSQTDSPVFDIVISNGRLMDPESGLDAIRNVGIRDGRIAAISEQPLRGKQALDARGLVVAPGFIDLHEHGQEPRNYEFQAHDGVTTSLELEVGTADVDAWYAQRGAFAHQLRRQHRPHSRSHAGNA